MSMESNPLADELSKLDRALRKLGELRRKDGLTGVAIIDMGKNGPDDPFGDNPLDDLFDALGGDVHTVEKRVAHLHPADDYAPGVLLDLDAVNSDDEDFTIPRDWDPVAEILNSSHRIVLGDDPDQWRRAQELAGWALLNTANAEAEGGKTFSSLNQERDYVMDFVWGGKDHTLMVKVTFKDQGTPSEATVIVELTENALDVIYSTPGFIDACEPGVGDKMRKVVSKARDDTFAKIGEELDALKAVKGVVDGLVIKNALAKAIGDLRAENPTWTPGRVTLEAMFVAAPDIARRVRHTWRDPSGWTFPFDSDKFKDLMEWFMEQAGLGREAIKNVVSIIDTKTEAS